MSLVTVATFRYAPSIGGAENYTRRLLQEIGPGTEIDVVTLLNSQRTDWLGSLINGERVRTETYEIDGRHVTALGRWDTRTRRTLAALAPGYHVPSSPIPWLMGRTLAPDIERHVVSAQVVHNVFMGREAFSAAFMIAAKKRQRAFVFTPLRHERPLGWTSPAFRRLYAQSDAVVALTKGEADWLAAHGARRDRLHVIGLGPQNDPEAPPTIAREVLGESSNLVLFIGQLHRYKGFEELIEAARILEKQTDAKFVFVGPDVRGNSSAFGKAGPNVKWLGSVSQSMRDSLLAACTVLCVPSSRESFGSVIVEAWACGKPVVGGPAGATRELVEDGVDGFVVPQEPSIIADRLGRLLGDAELAHDMGCKGREKVQQHYSWSAIARAHLDLYARLIS